MQKQLEIKVLRHLTLKYHEIDSLQGDLKDWTPEGEANLMSEILETGFAFTIHVAKCPDDGRWKSLDGLHRLMVVKKLVEDHGFSSPDIPCAEVEWDSLKMAHRRILQASSQYSRVTTDGLVDFVKMGREEIAFSPVDLGRFDLPDFDMDRFLPRLNQFPPNQPKGADPELEWSKEIGEKNNYIVLLFDDEENFKKACEQLKIARVNVSLSPSGNEHFITQGMGRVIDGERILR